MSANTAAELSAPARPPVVDYAVYALILRCGCSLGAAFALYGARDELSRSLADANKDKNWSAETLRHNVDVALRGNLITTVVMVVLVAILIKFIRDGRNWARWLYLAFALVVTSDVLQVRGFVQYDDLPTRLLTGMVGLSAIAALALLFLPESNAFFRPAGAPRGGLAGMFSPRVPGGVRPGPSGARLGGRRPGASSAAPDRESGPDLGAAAPAGAADASGAGGTPAGRPAAPRGKSRQSGQPGRNGRR